MSFPPKGLKVINKSNELMLFFNYLHRNGAEGEEKKRKTWRDGTMTHEVLTDKAGRVRETAGAKLLFSHVLKRI